MEPAEPAQPARPDRPPPGPRPPPEDRDLTAAEVAEILGVKRQTIYAYVSRGLLHRRLSLDGRTSLFDRSEVEQFRLGRRPEQDGEMRAILTTRLTRVGDDGLWIRGHDVVDLVTAGAGFVELAELAWGGTDDEAWPALGLGGGDVLGPGLRADDPAGLLDQLRILVAVAAGRDPLRHDLEPRSVRAAGRRVITAMVAGLGHNGLPEPEDGPPPGLVEALWSHLSPQEARADRLRALDVALALLVDHGLAASTLAARVAASVRADPYSVVATGLGVLGGPLHGRASGEVHELYRTAEALGPSAAVAQLHRRRAAAPGFGHAVYRTQDPRHAALMKTIVTAWAGDRRLSTVFGVRDLLTQHNGALANVDLALGALTYLSDMPTSGGEVIFAVSRTAGWLGHALEEYGEKPLRFRVRANYVGPGPVSSLNRSSGDRR